MARVRNLLRFQVQTGPAALFERVHFIYGNPQTRTLTLARGLGKYPRAILKALGNFDPQEWELVTVFVNENTGKFLKSSWRRILNGVSWVATLGPDDVVMSITKTNLGVLQLTSDTVRFGPEYERVRDVNAALMEEARHAQKPATLPLPLAATPTQGTTPTNVSTRAAEKCLGFGRDEPPAFFNLRPRRPLPEQAECCS